MKEFKQKESFKIPNNYFDQLEESILNETKRFSDASTFDIPSSYFDKLEEKILESTLEQQTKGKVRKLWFTISSVAACLLLFTFVYFNWNESEQNASFVIDFNLDEESVDPDVEHAVYESLYRSYFAEDDTKKSSNEISLDDLDNFYSDQQLSSSR